MTPHLQVAALVAALSTVSVYAETITVCAKGCDYTNINDAIDAAGMDGSYTNDVVLVGPGTYPTSTLSFIANPNLPGGIQIRAESPDELVTLDFQGQRFVYQGSASNPEFHGFRFVNIGPSNQGWLMETYWPFYFERCLIRMQDNPMAWSGIWSEKTIQFRDCLTEDVTVNLASSSSGGFYCTGSTLIGMQIQACSTYSRATILDSRACELWIAESCLNSSRGTIFTEECDCDGDGVIDFTAIDQGLVSDCDADMVPDPCEIEDGMESDCNQNQIPDACDLSTGNSLDVDLDGIPDECQCRADLNRNGSVEAGDLGLLVAAWGTDGSVIEDSDLDGDGVVRSSDLGLLLSAWGPCD